MNLKNISASLVHIFGWAIFLLFTIYTADLSSSRMNSDVIVISTVIFLIGMFYLNYMVLIPRLKSMQYLLIYIVVISILLALYYFLPRWIDTHPMHPPHFRRGEPRGMRHKILFERIRLFLFLFTYIFSTSVGVLKMLFSYREKQQKAEHEKSKAELNLLKSQVNPHFLFNTLNSIYFLTAQKSDAAPEAVLQLSDIMRYTLTDTKHDFVPIEKEITFLEKYIQLQKLRLSDKTKVDVTLPVAKDDLQIAPLLLIPFIENCFKFGVSNHHQSTISIKIQLTRQNELKAMISNRIFSTDSTGEQFGLANVRQRLEAIYQGKHKLETITEGESFTVLLLIDLNK